jgi:hypothetical protein
MTAVADSDFYTRSFYEALCSGSRSSAKAMLTHVFNLLGRVPPSVVDVGCGAGTWLRVALDLGASRVQGFDGAWVQKADLEIPANCFTSCDLATLVPGTLGSSERYDLVLSLEVAEHLPATAGPSFVATLCGLGDVVLFSAAIPHQGGANHINEVWPGYWNGLFREQGFECFDAVRSVLWMRPDVEWWYAQNALIFAKGQPWLREKLTPVAEPMPCVHPRKYLALSTEVTRLKGEMAELHALLEAEVCRHARASAEADAARRALQEITGSTTWRATAPLRAVVGTGKRLVRRLGGE